jgi:hypothetical protein
MSNTSRDIMRKEIQNKETTPPINGTKNSLGFQARADVPPKLLGTEEISDQAISVVDFPQRFKQSGAMNCDSSIHRFIKAIIAAQGVYIT